MDIKHISIKPPKRLPDLSSKMRKLADKEKRSLNEYLIALCEMQLKSPKKLF